MKTTHTCLIAVLVAAAVALASGCGGDSGSETQENATTPTGGDTGGETQENATPPTGSEAPSGTAANPPSELGAAHILIMHVSSASVPDDITRTKEEALALAQEIATKAKADGADFGALARKYSDGPSGPTGGELGTFAPQQMVKPFSDATINLEVGEVSDPVETEFGYHIIRRNK